MYPRYPSWLLLAAITVLAAVLRLWQLSDSLWVDELHTSWCVHDGLGDVAPRAAMGNQSPLYFYLVWGVTQLLGEREWTLRLVSLIAGVALIPAMFFAVRELLRLDEKTPPPEDASWPALLAAFLAAVDYKSVFFATEARPYACLELIAALALLLAAKLLREPTWQLRAGLIVCHLLMFYLHFTAGLYVGVALGTLLVAACFESSVKYSRGGWLTDASLTTLGFLPALPSLLEIATRRGNWLEFVQAKTIWELLLVFPWFIAPLVLLLVRVVLWAAGKRADKVITPMWFAIIPAVLFLIPVLTAWMLTWSELLAIFHPRYVVAVLPALLASSACLACIPAPTAVRRVSVAGLAILAIGSSELVWNWRAEGRLLVDRNEDWRGAVAAAGQESRLHPSWKILVHNGLIETDALRSASPADRGLRKYGLLPVKACYRLEVREELLVPLPRTEPGRVSDLVPGISGAGGCILVLRLSRDDAELELRRITVVLQSRRLRAEVIRRQSFGGVQVVTVEVRRL